MPSVDRYNVAAAVRAALVDGDASQLPDDLVATVTDGSPPPAQYASWSSQLSTLIAACRRGEPVQVARAMSKCHQEPWRGINLGGWLLLERGPSYPLFEPFPRVSSEWALLKKGLSAEALELHRRQHFTERDFREIRECGFNAVRIPFGYWVVRQAQAGEPYVGLALEILDQAVEWAGQYKLQVLLDLHGNPGGESGDHPCGRANPKWTWRNWRFEDSLEVLAEVAQRYGGYDHVTGLQVCNEPSEKVPAAALISYYTRAIATIRANGMPASRVAVVLPIYREHRAAEIRDAWVGGGHVHSGHDNVAFDLHFYHSLGGYATNMAHPRHCAATRKHGRVLAGLPGAVVGEWSLSRNGRYKDGEVAEWGATQRRTWEDQGTHGWFFWTWKDHPDLPDWSWRDARTKGWVPRALPLAGEGGAERPGTDGATGTQETNHGGSQQHGPPCQVLDRAPHFRPTPTSSAPGPAHIFSGPRTGPLSPVLRLTEPAVDLDSPETPRAAPIRPFVPTVASAEGGVSYAPGAAQAQTEPVVDLDSPESPEETPVAAPIRPSCVPTGASAEGGVAGCAPGVGQAEATNWGLLALHPAAGGLPVSSPPAASPPAASPPAASPACAGPWTTPGKARVRSGSPDASTRKRVRRAVVDLTEEAGNGGDGVRRRLCWGDEQQALPETLAAGARHRPEDGSHGWPKQAQTVAVR